MLTLSLALWPLAFDGRGNVQLAAVGERCPVCNNDLSLSDVHSEELTRVFLCPAVRGKFRKMRTVVFQKGVSDLVRNLQDEPHPSVLVADLDADIGEDKKVALRVENHRAFGNEGVAVGVQPVESLFFYKRAASFPGQ